MRKAVEFTDLSIADDPFSTALERAVMAAGFKSTKDFNEAMDRHLWSLLTPAEQREMAQYAEAEAMNLRWSKLVVDQMRKTIPRWDGWGWVPVPYTDEQKAAERRAFQGKPS